MFYLNTFYAFQDSSANSYSGYNYSEMNHGENVDSIKDEIQTKSVAKINTISSIDSVQQTKANVFIKEKITVNNLIVIDSTEKSVDSNRIPQPEKAFQFKQYSPPTERFNMFVLDQKKINYKSLNFWTEKTNSDILEKHIISIDHHYQRSQFNWTLVIGFISVLLLMGLKTYYQKFVNQVINTMVNFQLADKMLREKNILAKRAFLMMNINFILILSLFLLLLADYMEIHLTESNILDYWIILAITIGLLLLRLIVLRLTGYIFESYQLFNEQIHNNYLINKNIGLVLLPIVFTAIYTNPLISKIILFVGLIFLIIATIYKLIRGFQIILRNGVLLYYAILYLCTLELLPLAIGSKLLISLR